MKNENYESEGENNGGVMDYGKETFQLVKKQVGETCSV